MVVDKEKLPSGGGGGATVQLRFCAAPMRGAHNRATGGIILMSVFVAWSDAALLS